MSGWRGRRAPGAVGGRGAAWAALVLAWTVAAACGGDPDAREGPRPDLAVVWAGAWGFDARPCAEGTRPEAPHLERLLREGSRFTRVYAARSGAGALRGAVELGALHAALAREGYATARVRGAAALAELPVESPEPRFVEAWAEPPVVEGAADLSVPTVSSPAAADALVAALLDASAARPGREALVLVVGPLPEPPAPGCPILRGAPGSLFEGGLRLQLLAWGPERVPAARLDGEALLSVRDLEPTLARLARAPAPEREDVQAQDVTAALAGPGFERSRSLLWRRDGPPTGPDDWPVLAVRRGPWKLLLDPEARRLALYDVAEDPGERHDVARARPGVAEYLTATVLAWAREAAPGP